MNREIEHMKEMINKARISGEAELIANREYLQRIVNYLDTLNRENSRLRELCDKYEEEHDSTFITWQETIRRHYEAIKILKKHKQDLDYEPWSEYKISGKILFDLVKALEGVDEE